MSGIVYIGPRDNPLFTFYDDQLMDIVMDTTVNVVGEELCADTMEIEVNFNDENGTLRSIGWATPVYYYSGSELVGKFYSTKVTRIGRERYKIYTTSSVGILGYEQFYGGIYSGDTVQSLVEKIIKTNGAQPYKGVYTKVTREQINGDSAAKLDPVGLGQYTNQGQTLYDETQGGSFGSATMSSKLHAKFTLYGFLGALRTDQEAQSATSIRVYMLGCCARPGAASNITKYQYGLYMTVTRANTSSPWPSFGEVVFCYGTTEISLGTPSSNTTYEVDVDPVAGTAIINGTTYSILLDNSVADDLCALHCYGGGVFYFTYTSSGLAAGISTAHGNCLSAKYEYYTVTAQDGTAHFNAVTVVDQFSGNMYGLDKVFLIQRGMNDASVDADDLTSAGSIASEFPLFEGATNFQSEIINDIRYADGVADMLVYGWLPIGTKREALYQLLFSQNINLIKGASGGILITNLANFSDRTISADDIYNEGSEEQIENTNVIEVTEHSYIRDNQTEAITVFERQDASGGYYYAPFASAPIFGDIEVTGLEVVFHNCNVAIVRGAGTITAKAYTHMENVQRRTIANYPDGRTVSVQNATLVTAINSANILDRMESYYGSAKKVVLDIVHTDERCGVKYDLVNAFGEPVDGFLTKATRRVSSIIRAACEFIVGYTSPELNDVFSHYVVLTGNGTWAVPESVFAKDEPRIRAVLIGGGNGGSGGFAGANGTVTAQGADMQSAEGGAVGEAGSPGKVLDIIIENPAHSYSYDCGAGGTGGAISHSHNVNNPGTSGGATTISGGGNTYSSESGVVFPSGYLNFMTGDLYAKKFVSVPWNEDDHLDPIIGWYDGSTGRGGDSSFEAYSQSIAQRKPAKSCFMVIPETKVFWRGNNGAITRGSSGGWIADGGSGGGAGYGQDGFPGTNASHTSNKAYPGNGGNGGNATAIPPKATDYNPLFYGYGGHPGGGGGAGGSTGVIATGWPYATATPGTGGYGGQGGDGGDGCVLIYY